MPVKKTIHHIVDGPAEMWALDATDAVRRHPDEWSPHPWPAKEMSAARAKAVKDARDDFDKALKAMDEARTDAGRAEAEDRKRRAARIIDLYGKEDAGKDSEKKKRVSEAQKALAEAQDALKGATSDEDKRAAQALVDEATEALADAKAS